MYLCARLWHQGIHMVWKQTSVPSLSKMTRRGLKKAGLSLAALADGDVADGVEEVDAGEGGASDEDSHRVGVRQQ